MFFTPLSFIFLHSKTYTNFNSSQILSDNIASLQKHSECHYFVVVVLSSIFSVFLFFSFFTEMFFYYFMFPFSPFFLIFLMCCFILWRGLFGHLTTYLVLSLVYYITLFTFIFVLYDFEYTMSFWSTFSLQIIIDVIFSSLFYLLDRDL